MSAPRSRPVPTVGAAAGTDPDVSSSPPGERAGGWSASGGRCDVFHAGCPAHHLLGHLAGRWAVLVLRALDGGPLRYHELRRRIDGVSDKMLAATLRTLTGDGLLERSVTDDAPPQVSYALSPLGAGALASMEPLLAWIRENAEAVERHRVG